jgi:hypothetical protein
LAISKAQNAQPIDESLAASLAEKPLVVKPLVVKPLVVKPLVVKPLVVKPLVVKPVIGVSLEKPTDSSISHI